MTYTIRTDIAVPPPLTQFNRPGYTGGRQTKYPFPDLLIGQSFIVPVEADQDAKKIKGNLARSAAAYVKSKQVVDRSFLVRHWVDEAGNPVLDDQGRRQVLVFAVQPKDL